jgi:hypothetical protein
MGTEVHRRASPNAPSSPYAGIHPQPERGHSPRAVGSPRGFAPTRVHQPADVEHRYTAAPGWTLVNVTYLDRAWAGLIESPLECP